MIIRGNENLLGEKSAVILNSSQSKTPCGNDSWVKATITAAKSLTGSGRVIVTSLGLNTWELAVFLVGLSGGNQIIVSPEIGDDDGGLIFDRTIKQFELVPRRTAMVFVKPDKDSKKNKAVWINRDKAAVKLSGLLVPVSIRSKGKLAKLIEEQYGHKQIETGYNVEYSKPLVSPPRYPKEKIDFRVKGWDFLTHWTRTRHGPWPGQSRYSYYAGLIASGNEYPNNALKTLLRIIDEKRIRGSSMRIRDGQRVIGFTESDPAKVLSGLRWLPKRTGWNFEPYGIAISKPAAIRLGIRPVFYGNSDDYAALPGENRPYFQSVGQKDVDWSKEKEWRHLGDIDLSKISPGDLKFLVWRKDEADYLGKIVKSEVLALSGA